MGNQRLIVGGPGLGHRQFGFDPCRSSALRDQRRLIEKLTRQIYRQRSERTVRLLDQIELAFEELESSATEDEIAAAGRGHDHQCASLCPQAPGAPALPVSQKRADDVMQFLISQGVNPALISAQGFGDTNPVASNDTPQGRAQNRRVVLSVPASGC
jgi:hypothetical protein